MPGLLTSLYSNRAFPHRGPSRNTHPVLQGRPPPPAPGMGSRQVHHQIRPMAIDPLVDGLMTNRGKIRTCLFQAPGNQFRGPTAFQVADHCLMQAHMLKAWAPVADAEPLVCLLVSL